MAPPSSVASEAIAHAKSRLGTPYVYGAEGPRAFDCSGLVQWAYRKAGVSLSRTTYTQYREGNAVSTSDLRPGDLVFFYYGPRHVGMYLGGQQMIHAPKAGGHVEIVRMSGHYDRNFAGARRIA
ncbi:hypothetical protein GCM10022402_08980 [Salinactinospora qingdaonensis]|uniref:NlpC/P60 domain-containing protein n=2 Tax=Salinactinospora qingdaonensis TaxID=702744 RepID=A0ABP7F3T2_9ACTN